MITLLFLLVPLLGGLAMLAWPQLGSRILATTMATISLILSVYVTVAGLPEPLQFAWLADLNISFHLAWDGISLVLVLLTNFLVPIITWAAGGWSYQQKERMLGLILLTQAALNGVFLAQDAFLFYFFFEAALVPVYFIAALWGGENASRITFKMFVYTIFGSLFMLVALIYLYAGVGSADLGLLKAYAQGLGQTEQDFLFLAFFLAFAIKMPLFPFHTWQPDTYTESPTPATMLLSGLLSKMGVYGLMRIAVPFAPLAVQQLGSTAMVLALIGLTYGSIIAIQQSSIKRLVAYSSFAHMGLMAAGVLTGTQEGYQGALFQMVAHGVNAVGLFYIVKAIGDRTGSYELNQLGGLTTYAPKLSILFMVILLGSVALPLTNGFVGEFLLLKSVFDYNAWLGGLAGLTIIFGAVYMLRLMQRSMFGPDRAESISDLSSTDLGALIPIALVVLITGFVPSLLLALSESSVFQIVGGLIK
ncbi:MAG: NuoM family protein [Spirosomataceae bacterium]